MSSPNQSDAFDDLTDNLKATNSITEEIEVYRERLWFLCTSHSRYSVTNHAYCSILVGLIAHMESAILSLKQLPPE